MPKESSPANNNATYQFVPVRNKRGILMMQRICLACLPFKDSDEFLTM